MFRRNISRFLAGFLTAAMCITGMPEVAFAENSNEDILLSASDDNMQLSVFDDNNSEDLLIENEENDELLLEDASELATSSSEADDEADDDALEVKTEEADSNLAPYTEESEFGYISPGFDAPISHAEESGGLRGETPRLVSYNSVEEGLVTSVKNQNPYGTCWAFAMCGAAETSMIKYDKKNNNNKAIEDYNYSERQLAYFMYNKKGINDPAGNTEGDYFSTDNSSTEWVDIGGNAAYSSIFLKNYSGGMGAEENAPYTQMPATVDNSLCYEDVAHLQQIRFINETDTDTIKDYVVSNGSVITALYWEQNNNYFNSVENAYYCNEKKTTNHQVLIVGYDDNYPKTNFKTQPKNNGAWLIKNSWGANRFKDGYLWVSYEDKTLDDFTAVEYEPASNYKHNYHYDGGVCYSYTGYNNDNKVETMVANVFTAKGVEKLDAVGIGFGSADVEYSLQIYKNLKTGTPDSGEPMFTDSTGNKTPLTGCTTEAGFYTIKLPKSIMLEANEKFSVVFSCYARNSGVTYILTDKTADYGWCANCTNEIEGTSFRKSSTSKTWNDLQKANEKCTIRINAYTNDVKMGLTKVELSADKIEEYSGGTIPFKVKLAPVDFGIEDINFDIYKDADCTDMADSSCGVSVGSFNESGTDGEYNASLDISLNATPGTYYLKAIGYNSLGESVFDKFEFKVKALYSSDFEASYVCYDDTDYNREHNVYTLSFVNNQTKQKLSEADYDSFTSSDTSVAVVDSKGNITIKKEGSTIVTAKLKNGALVSGVVKTVAIHDDNAVLDSGIIDYVFTNVDNKISDLNDILDSKYGKGVWVIENPTAAVVASNDKPVQEFRAYHLDSNTGFMRSEAASFKVFELKNFGIKNVPEIVNVGEIVDGIEIGYEVIGAIPNQQFMERFSSSYEKSGNGFYLYENTEDGKYCIKGYSPGKGQLLAKLLYRKGNDNILVYSGDKDFSIELGADYSVKFVRVVDDNEEDIKINKTYEYDFDLGEDDIDSTKKVFKFKYDNYSGNVKLSVKDASVVKLGTVDAAKKEISLIPKSFGSTVITATFDDEANTTIEYKVRVLSKNNKSFVLNNDTLTFNSALKSDVKTVELLNSSDAWLKSVELVDAKGKPVSGFSVSFNSAYKDDTVKSKIIIGLDGATKGITGYLKCAWDVYSTDYHGEDVSLKINLKVSKSVPKVTAALIRKPNAFLRGTVQMSANNEAAGLIEVNCSEALIDGAKLSCANNKPFGYTGYINNFSPLQKCEMPILIGDASLIKNNKGIVNVTLDGYKEPVKVKVTINTISGKPVLDVTKLTLYTGSDDTKGAFIHVIDKQSGRIMKVENVAFADTAFNDYYLLEKQTKSGNPGIYIGLKGSTKNKSGDTLKINVSCEDWRSDIGNNGSFTLALKVTAKDLSKSSLKLSKSTVTMYVYKGANATALNDSLYYTDIYLNGGCDDSKLINDLRIEEISKSSTYNNSIFVTNNDGKISLHFNSSKNIYPSKGTYKYKFVLPKENFGGKKDITATLNIKVVNVSDSDDVWKPSKCVTVKTKGKIDVLNRSESFVTVTPKFSNLPADRKLYSPQIGGPNKDLFKVESFDESTGIVKLALLESKAVKSKDKYSINLSYRINTGSTYSATITTSNFAVSLTQGKVSTSLSADTFVYSNSSHNDKAVLAIKAKLASGKELTFSDAKLLSGTEDFAIAEFMNNNVILNHNPSGHIGKTKSYNIKISLTLRNAFTDSKPVVLNYKVKIQ